MSASEPGVLTREHLLDYFVRAATPRDDWQVGMEVEKMGRSASGGHPIPYEGQRASVRAVLEWIRDRRGGDPVQEGEHLIGLDAPWGAISLEPGGQVEWSSRPRNALDQLARDVDEHLATMVEVGETLGIRWLDEAVDPELPLGEMSWMPKARYNIMRPYLGARGRLAHRMMTQTASIQCALDFADTEDWRRKFKAAALMAPVATALFANSSRIDGADTGYVSYRQRIWRETDPDRCGLPGIVFDPGFEIEAWVDWVLAVPTIFRHRARGLVPGGGVPFEKLLELQSCDAVGSVDWESHISTIFTDVRSYTYIEVRSADLPPDPLVLAVPALWTGLLYHDGALDATLALGSELDDETAWNEAMEQAARRGVQGAAGDRRIGELASEALSLALQGLRDGASCAGDGPEAADALRAVAEYRRLEPKA